MRIVVFAFVLGLLAVTASAQYGTVCCQCREGGFGQVPEYVSATPGNCGTVCNLECGSDEVDAQELGMPVGNVNPLPGSCQNTIEEACPIIDPLSCDPIVDVSDAGPYTVDQEITLSATISGGLAPYACLWNPSVSPGSGPMDGCQEVVYTVTQSDVDTQSIVFTVQVNDAGGVRCDSQPLTVQTQAPNEPEVMGCCDLTESTVYQGTEPSACTTPQGCAEWGGIFNAQAECKFDSECTAMVDCDTVVTCCVADNEGALTPELQTVTDCIDMEAITVTLADQGMCPTEFDNFFCCFEGATVPIGVFTIEFCLDNGGELVEQEQLCDCATELQPPPSDNQCCQCLDGSTVVDYVVSGMGQSCDTACQLQDCNAGDGSMAVSPLGSGWDVEVCLGVNNDCRNDAPSSSPPPPPPPETPAPTPAPTPSPPPTADKKISPVLECVREEGPGQFVAVFGYANRNAFDVSIPIGTNNRFSPAPQDRGQTTLFAPGRQVGVFEVPFDGSNLVWTLRSPNGQQATATASSGSSRCPEEPQCDPELEIVCNAALTGDCNVAGGQNIGNRLSSLSGRLDDLENA